MTKDVTVDDILNEQSAEHTESTPEDKGIQNSEQGSIEAQRIKELEAEVKQLKEQLDRPVFCKRCGRDAAMQPVKVSDAVARAWFRCLLGQQLFSHTLSAYDGRLNMTFTELNGSMMTKQEELLRNVQSEVDYTDMMTTIVLLAGLTKVWAFDPDADTSVTLYERSSEERAALLDNPRKAKEDLINTLGTTSYNVVRKASSVFVLLLASLIETGQDENFYSGAGLS